MFWITNSSALFCIPCLFVGGSSTIPKWDLRIHIKFNELALNPIPIDVTVSRYSVKVDDKKEYWQKYREKEEEIELDKDEKLSLITWLMQKIPERKIRFQTPDNYNSLKTKVDYLHR